jgi:predicted negative regulator of RcsB-dependent stress response
MIKEDFTIFDPTEHIDFKLDKIRKLESNNTFLLVCLVIVVCLAGYHAYQYYQLKDEKH